MRRAMVLLALPLLALAGCTDFNAPRPTHSPVHESRAVPTPIPSSALPVALPTHLDAPAVQSPVVAVASGTTRTARGALSRPVRTLQVTITCQGAGFPSIHTSDGFTANSNAIGVTPPPPGAVCGETKPLTTSYGLIDMRRFGKLRYSVTPHGNIVWAVTFADLT